MKILSFSAALFGAGLLIAAPAFAQTKPEHGKKSAQTTSEQRSHSGSAGGATAGSPQDAKKQRTDGGPSDGGFYTGPASGAVPKQQ
jgi:hypothetical protein